MGEDTAHRWSARKGVSFLQFIFIWYPTEIVHGDAFRISSSSLDVGGTGPLTPLDVEAERGLGSTYSLPLLHPRFAVVAASATVLTWREGRGVFEGVLRCSSKSRHMPPGVVHFFDCFAGGLSV